MSPKVEYVTSGQVAKRYSRSSRTIMRWVKDPPDGFPAPVWINGRMYWPEVGLQAWERSLASNAASNQKAA